MTKLREIYEGKSPVLRRAEDELRSILEKIVATIEDKTLVRAEVRRVRIKELPSLQRKAEKNGWKADDALSSCGDLIGGRVVCNNVEDVYRFAELLKESLPILWGDVEVQDYTKKSTEGGYKALHVNFRLDAGQHPFHPDLVPCEVQIRSRLQDAWAELSHDDFYKQPNLPADLRARVIDLAEVLAAADKIASDIRLRVMQETASPKDRPDLTHVSAGGLAFIFRELFGRSPPDYAIRRALNLCDQLDIATLEDLPEVLGRTEFRDRVSETYRSIVGVSIAVEDVFLVALYAIAEDDNKAIKWVRGNARRERRELEQFARREMLSSLPATIEEFIEDLEDSHGEADVELWAEALGATTDCAICSTTVIQPYSFAEAAVQHYEISGAAADDVHERIETALQASGVETGGWGDRSLCAHHNAQVAKDV